MLQWPNIGRHNFIIEIKGCRLSDISRYVYKDVIKYICTGIM